MRVNLFRFIKKVLGKFTKDNVNMKENDNKTISNSDDFSTPIILGKSLGNLGEGVGNSSINPKKIETKYSNEIKNFSGFDDFDPSKFK